MRILVVNSEYGWFLASLYRTTPGLETRPYAEQLAARNATLFGVTDAYPAAFRELGHESVGVYGNNPLLQLAWAREHGDTRWSVALERELAGSGGVRERARALIEARRGVPRSLVHNPRTNSVLQWILLAQIEAYRPDVVLNQDLGLLEPETIRVIKATGAALVGQHAAMPLGTIDATPYDLVVSSFLPTVEELQRRRVRAALNRLAFDVRVLGALGPQPRSPRWELTFVGSLQPIHASRLRFLEEVAALVPELSVWSPDLRFVPRSSPLRKRHVGAVWGRKMYEVLRNSRVTLNHHGDVEPYANNMRLYEATGIGTVLLTDMRKNLPELFVPGTEVLTYRSAAEAAAVVAGLGAAERDAVAAAGQRRTLHDHTYRQTVGELVALLESAAP